MRFQLTSEQRALQDGARQVLVRWAGARPFAAPAPPVPRTPGAADTHGASERDPSGPPELDRALWRELGAAGFFALRLPEADGGAGAGLAEAVLVFEEAGRALLPGPLAATHLAAGTVPGAATGETVVTVVDGGLVEWLAAADVVRGDASGAVPVRSVDPLTPLHRVPATGTPTGAGTDTPAVTGSRNGTADPANSAPETPATSAPETPAAPSPETPTAPAPAPETPAAPAPEADPVAVLLTAAEQLGTATRVCELAVQHARTREQFGQPIGAFQAVKHLCADMLVRAATARAAVYAAAVTGDPVDIVAARLLADEAAVRGARDCLQVHGGMGFTWESEVHLHLKRAWLRARRHGGGTESEDLLAADLLAGSRPERR
jgi:alkylation response protein AidB-like acyl-CoA dehydrogenase